MIRTITIIVLIMAMNWHPATAGQAVLTWDPNHPAPDGYALFQRESDEAYDYTKPVWTGPGKTHTITGLTPGVTYHFVVRAFRGDDCSGNSNEATHTPTVAASVRIVAVDDGEPVDPANAPPGKYRVEYLQGDVWLAWAVVTIDGQGFVGNTRSKIFHKPGCRYYDCNTCTARFKTRSEAVDAGYKPCGVCKP